jgi:hypothetical protein
VRQHNDAGWSSLVARWAHNPEVAGSNPAPATKLSRDFASHLLSGVGGVARFGSRIGSIAAWQAYGSVVGTIGATTTRTGLTVHSELDPSAYPTGVTIPDEVMVALPLVAHDWHPT